MYATVTYPYRDRDTLEIHYTGDTVELAADRFTELEAAGYVDVAEEPNEAAAEEPNEAEEPTEAKTEEPNPADMTVAELHAAIEAAGGFAPKKAAKAELVKLYEAL